MTRVVFGVPPGTDYRALEERVLAALADEDVTGISLDFESCDPYTLTGRLPAPPEPQELPMMRHPMLGAVAALALGSAGSMFSGASEPLRAPVKEVPWTPRGQGRRYRRGYRGKRTTVGRYKGSAQAKRATRRGGNPAAHG